MDEYMYDIGSISIAAVLMLLMLIAIEVGFRIGVRWQVETDESSREQIGTIQSSVIGMLALVLGFTFSISLDRYNSRSMALVEESNSIGTAYLRAELLSSYAGENARRLIREYAAVRLEASSVPLSDHSRRKALLDEALRLQGEMWQSAVGAAQDSPGPVSVLFVQAINEVIDAYGLRISELDRHVPEFILLLLFGSFIVVGGIIWVRLRACR